MHNATPGVIKVKIPMIGCSWNGDKGLPLCGLRNQTFRLRLQLRTLEQLVESTDPADYSPTPWTKRFTQDRDGVLLNIEANAIEKVKIGQPSIVLKTKQLYLSNEAREQLAKEPAEVAYIRYFDNAYSINQLDYAPLDKGSGANLIKFLYANYTVERIISYFRSTPNILRNRLWDFSNSLAPDGQFYNSLQLTIAGRTREGPWEPDVWTKVITDAKEERNPARNIAEMNWSRGWRIEDEPPAIREPTGGINFTTADRPMLTIGLNDVEVNPVLGYKQTQLTCCCETWALYRIKNGRGGLEYAN
jgi:hypothetical protein